MELVCWIISFVYSFAFKLERLRREAVKKVGKINLGIVKSYNI